jgi:hypothetical protein
MQVVKTSSFLLFLLIAEHLHLNLHILIPSTFY